MSKLSGEQIFTPKCATRRGDQQMSENSSGVFKCHQCSQNFDTTAKRVTHVREVHQDRCCFVVDNGIHSIPFQYTVTGPENFNIVRNPISAKFHCPKCDFCSANPGSLKKHICKQHQSENPQGEQILL
jgi:hypothetical protein